MARLHHNKKAPDRNQDAFPAQSPQTQTQKQKQKQISNRDLHSNILFFLSFTLWLSLFA